MTTTAPRDPFAPMKLLVPTRYAPGFTMTPYDYPGPDSNTLDWHPVIFSHHNPGDGSRIWLVEPYPAARADGTDGQDPIESGDGVRVGVVRDGALPRPVVAGDPDGDWYIPQYARCSTDFAYDVWVETQEDLMAAWCEAHAIASALNSQQVAVLRLDVGDIEVLMAAERRALFSESRYAGTPHEMTWTPVAGDRPQRVSQTRIRRLRNAIHMPLIRPFITTDHGPEDRRSTRTEYQLTTDGIKALAAIRRTYVGPTRCRVCGCTEDRACPGSCAWVPGQAGAGALCTACVVGKRLVSNQRRIPGPGARRNAAAHR
jgi:hypothetical protein